MVLIFWLVASGKVFSQQGPPQILRFSSPHTSFPDSVRAAGHLYDSVLYTAAEHYMDSSVMLVVPIGLQTNKKVDLFFWFHGWHNNIDTAAVFYGLVRQFVASHRNAVLVLAETAKNAPDSYGGKLENPGMFKALVNDVLVQLKTNKLISANTKPGNIVLAGHSGAYRLIAHILQNGQLPVQEVLLFDALYSQLDKYMAWIENNQQQHFIHWYTNKGEGTDVMSDTMMAQLAAKHIAYTWVEEATVTPAIIKANRILFIHSPREHNVIINNPDDLQLLLEQSWVLKKSNNILSAEYARSKKLFSNTIATKQPLLNILAAPKL